MARGKGWTVALTQGCWSRRGLKKLIRSYLKSLTMRIQLDNGNDDEYHLTSECYYISETAKYSYVHQKLMRKVTTSVTI